MKRRTEHTSLTTHLTAAALTYLVLNASLREWFLNWGAEGDEAREALPGDEFAKRISSTRAITIHASVEDVWQWLVQIGQDRAGFYSYDGLERLVLADIHNADRIVPAWQQLEAGDTIRLASRLVYGDRPLLRVLAVEPNHYLVLEHWGAFVLRRIDASTTRMIFRTHTEERSLSRQLADFLFFDPLHFVMERKMMLGIKRRAEERKRTTVREIAATTAK
ncbi:MAG: hypothetical protein ACXV7D_07285 [Thermoanaerobaculia bacterium]